MEQAPEIIQGGPELALSTWELARAVSLAGGLGVVSGVALPVLLARRLALGDVDGHFARALDAFPSREMARRVWEHFFVAGGKLSSEPFVLTRQPTIDSSPALLELTLLATFAEVYLAKEDHAHPVGIAFSGRAPMPLLPALYGAMLAGVDFVLIHEPSASLAGALDRLAAGEAARLALSVAGDDREDACVCEFDPKGFEWDRELRSRRPRLLLVIGSPAGASALALQPGAFQGCVWAPDRWSGESIPAPELEALRHGGLPCWVASRARPGALAEAKAAGAAGIYLQTAFEFCAESRLQPELKQQVLERCRQGDPGAFLEDLPSPGTRPLKLFPLAGSATDPAAFARRQRFCDVGYLRQPYRKEDGSLGYRCPGEPLDYYMLKGGHRDRATEQRCLCNGLLAAVGLAQIQSGSEAERALVPAWDDVRDIATLLPRDASTYTAADVVRQMQT